VADLVITRFEAWPQLFSDAGFEVVVDPVVYRIGDLFLTGGRYGRGSEARRLADQSWSPIGEDIGALVTFFDLLVLNERVPAFDYSVTFNPLSARVNKVGGERIIYDVGVKPEVYNPTRKAVVAHLHDRMAGGPFVPAPIADQIRPYLAEIRYQWAPNISEIEAELPDDRSRTVARFVVGHLLFAGYAQMSGLPHVLSPRRGRLMAAAGLPVHHGVPFTEAVVWDRVGERLTDAPGWRDEDLPWTPSFLPYLLQQTEKHRGGTDTLLKHAMDLRNKQSVEKYRKVRREALGDDDAEKTVDARLDLADAATKVAKDLDRDREELAYTRSFVVGAGPKAIGELTGAGMGAVIGGPPGGVAGALAGGLVGAVAEEVLRPATERLWGWIIGRLPFVNARKLLSRAARAEMEVGADLSELAKKVWRRGPS